jgi:glycine dehydrogenase
MAAMYAVYHGPEGITQIAKRVHQLTAQLKGELEALGITVKNGAFFDTLTVDTKAFAQHSSFVLNTAVQRGVNLRAVDDHHVGVSLDESVVPQDLIDLVNIFAQVTKKPPITTLREVTSAHHSAIPTHLQRSSKILPQPVFNTHHSETEMLRYIHDLQSKDLSLCHSMIPLGSCTMKLNSTTSMIPLSWAEYSTIHPFVPVDQAAGYAQVIKANCIYTL